MGSERGARVLKGLQVEEDSCAVGTVASALGLGMLEKMPLQQ